MAVGTRRPPVPSGEALPGGPGGARGGGWGAGEGPRARGGRRGAPAGSAGRSAPRPLPSPPPGRPGTAARLHWELCSFPSNYLSEQRVGGGPKKGPSLLEGLPISIRGALWVREGAVPASPARPPSLLSSLSPFLFCCLYSRTRHSLGCFSPSRLGVCSVDAQRAQIHMGPYLHLTSTERSYTSSCRV
ncbi:collagen alpha-2(VIII) chain-like [Prionailurus viverrinus]|uniref:collagen alpha-2(VIII) chain-like n=1 Tax=Prionailurus viverrinus TaxID=61388 RepID=UPI001FF414C0|nr:collagen alpha-2(VIII) chain-like [Prionailurus viverrinus]